jgi:hypothetical protein
MVGIGKDKFLSGYFLRGFMAFARDQYHVASARLRERLGDR